MCKDSKYVLTYLKMIMANLLYVRLLPVFFCILNTCLCKKLTLDDLHNIVSRKDSKSWLDRFNATNSNNPYCHLCCINIALQPIGTHCGSHTLCKYPANRAGPACKGFIEMQFTRIDKVALLDAHNTLRNIVASGLELRGKPGPQPSAANMRVMQWDDELALVAERWVAQCIYSNDICRDLERFPVGQNIAHGNFATNNELSYIKSWYDEVEQFNSSDTKNFNLAFDEKVFVSTKYTQMVWADTYQIGCARAIFQESKGSEVIYREHFICNYGPTGNIPNQPVYLIGVPCSACHEGTSCTVDHPALCGGEVINRISDNFENITKFQPKKKRVKILKTNDNSANDTMDHFITIYLFYFYLFSAILYNC